MTRPRLLDLFCGAGGCSVGYARAGFDVVGVDIEPHPDYPFPMLVADAMELAAIPAFLDGFDVVHASPPCQHFSTMTADPSRHIDLLTPIRGLLRDWGGTYVIENVPGAAPMMRYPVRVCGSSFGLRVRRHRFFESNAFIHGTDCLHSRQGTPVGVYGDHPEGKAHRRPTTGTSRGVKAVDLWDGQDAMGIDWMGWNDLTEAVPPIYTEFIGEQLLAALESDVLTRPGSATAHMSGTSVFPGRSTNSDPHTDGPAGNASFAHSRQSTFEVNGEYSHPLDRGRDAPG